ncbi:MAG: peptidyl-prolyl cis-trans isomerase [Gammaproteobacteria bacterium]|nr:peptidyl-prolyl cis-trans isomerase [Gammaproteobacteria bacterium]
MGSFIKQPLLWFFIIGTVLFVADSRFSVDRNEIYVSVALQDRLGLLWQTETGLTASSAEQDSLVENWIQEEVLYQEALRLGLDQEDSIIRRRLVQKLNFIAESEPMPELDEATLEDFYNSYIENYTLPVRYSFRQLYFPMASDAQAALRKIAEGAEASELGHSSMLSDSYAYRSELDLNATFGSSFALQLKGMESGSWQGPIESGFGSHLVFLTNIHPQEGTPLSAITEQVASDYGQNQQENARQLYLDNLLKEYDIVVEAR